MYMCRHDSQKKLQLDSYKLCTCFGECLPTLDSIFHPHSTQGCVLIAQYGAVKFIFAALKEMTKYRWQT